MRNKRDFVPRLCISTCSRRISRGRYEDAVASSTAPRGFGCTCGRVLRLAVGLLPMFYYKESALFLGFYSGFTRGEYLIVIVDFIVALRRTKGRGRRTLRSPPSPSSGLHLIHPGVSAAAGKCRLPRAWGNLGIRYPVQVAYRHFDMTFGCFVFGLRSLAFQLGCWACVSRFSLLGG